MSESADHFPNFPRFARAALAVGLIAGCEPTTETPSETASLQGDSFTEADSLPILLDMLKCKIDNCAPTVIAEKGVDTDGPVAVILSTGNESFTIKGTAKEGKFCNFISRHTVDHVGPVAMLCEGDQGYQDTRTVMELVTLEIANCRLNPSQNGCSNVYVF